MTKTDTKPNDQVETEPTTLGAETDIKVQVQKPCEGKLGARSIPVYVDPA